MKLSVIIPVYNELATIGAVIEKVKAVDLEREIIVVDDCSTDGTRAFLREIQDPEVRVLFHDRNKGKEDK